jgi:hypothetical protein
MSPNIKLSCLIGGMMLIMLPVRLYSQDPDREHILTEDIKHLGERAVRDRIISEEEHREMISFIRDSLPEGTDLTTAGGMHRRCSTILTRTNISEDNIQLKNNGNETYNHHIAEPDSTICNGSGATSHRRISS